MTDPADLATRLLELEARVAALEAGGGRGPEERAAPRPPGSPPAGADFWALDTLTARFPKGALVFAGHVSLPGGQRYGWQEGALTPDLLATDWTGAAPALAALGHPLRLALLAAVLRGEGSAADLQANPALAGAGKLYHHLRELQSAGWLTPQGRGRYAVPAQRVVPLLVILRACGPLPPADPGA